MLADERRQNILSLIQERGSARTGDLAKIFKVSDQTIRRDLMELEVKGLISKGYGGGVLVNCESVSYRDRAIQRRQEKLLIAKAAVAHVKRGMTVMIGPGTTTEVVAQLLDGLDVHIVTNSLAVARAISSRDTTVSLTGGRYRPDGELVTGAWTGQNFDALFADLGIIGISGIGDEAGYTVTEADEALVLRQFIRVSKKAIIVTDSSKFHRVARESVAPLGAVHLLITDSDVSKGHLALLEGAGVKVMVASRDAQDNPATEVVA